MAKQTKQSTVAVKFPVKGLERRWGFQGQGPFTTVDCDNVWPTQWSTGRERGGSRPGLSQLTNSISGSSPVNWCEATWQKGSIFDNPDTTDVDEFQAVGAYRGVAVASDAGVKVTASDGKVITSGASAYTCAVYMQYLFSASGINIL